MPAGFSPRLTASLALLAAAVMAIPSPAAAQPRLSIGGDLGYAPSYVWRGVTRSERLVLTPAAFVRLDAGANVLSAGAWSAVEMRKASPGTLTLRPPDEWGPGELDLWAQYTRHVARTDVSLGVVRYVFADNAPATEAYLQIWPDSLPIPIDLRGAAYVGLEGDHPAYAEVEASHSFSLIPLPSGPPSLLVGATAGFSLNAPDDARPVRFADTGPTHLMLGATLLIPVNRTTAHIGVRHQRSFDEAARQLAPGRESDHRTWGEFGVSYVIGTPRKAK
ncbi:MAG TPA: hypothetical protein VF092_15225 [Longimicrobium sp.]